MKIATMPTDSRFNIGILPKPITIADDPNTTGMMRLYFQVITQ